MRFPCFGRSVYLSSHFLAAILVASGLPNASPSAPCSANEYHDQIQADWLKQADAWRMPPGGTGIRVPTFADAAGAVDGVKNGKYAFHTDRKPNPWWQVDLEQQLPIGRIVVYNRLDYAPGLHNADNLLVLTSDNGQDWTLRYDNQGKFFGGVGRGEPLTVVFKPPVTARFVRLQVRSDAPIWFHLDEVEVYGTADPQKNIALKKPADQSSVSQWSTVKPHVIIKPDEPYPTKYFLERGRMLAADLRTVGVDTRSAERELDEIAEQLAKMPRDASEESQQAVYLKARRTIRQLAFANPLLDFDRLVFVKRFTQETYPDVCLNHMPWVSRPGGDICTLAFEGPDVPPRVQNVIRDALGPGHVHGMDLRWDAERIVFGYAKATSNEPPEGWRDRRTNYDLRRTVEPTHIFEIGVDGNDLRQITDGQWSDLDPTYAANGDIVFVSERCGCSLQCNEYDKDETSCNLFVCRPDGSDIRWMSVSKDGDYLPHCLDDGSIAYTRWEYQERSWANIQSIWFLRPDGTGADALFKQHLNNPWALEDMRSIPHTGRHKLVAIAAGHHTLAAGPVVVVTPSDGMNDPKAIRIVTPGVQPPEGGMSGTPVDQGGVFDRSGFYMTPWALSDKYFLVSYGYGGQTDATGYALYLIDVFGTKELLYRDPEISCFAPIPLRPRREPPVVPDVTDRNVDYAVCSASDVTHGVEGIDPKTARYLRISQRLQWPYDNQNGGWRYTEKARPNNWTPARVLGTVPIEPDGSTLFKVPADTPVYFQLLDENHMELRRMRSFISFQPGETRGCVGCHETREEAPPDQGFPLALLHEPLDPVPPPWGDRPICFLRDIQPIFDEHCVSCHSGLKPAAGLDFCGGLTASPSAGPGHGTPIPGYGHNRAFDTIIERKLVAWSAIHGDASITQPLEFGSHKSPLVHALRDGACSKRASLTDEQWLRLVTWIDANAPYHDQFVNKRAEPQPYSLPDDRELLTQIAAIHTQRCGSCHQANDITRADWVDLQRPERSLFLAAPLAKAAGGAGSCDKSTYENCDDTDYRSVLNLVKAAVEKAWKHSRRDLKAIRRQDVTFQASVAP